MTKTPEELTKEWKAGELEDGLYYILLENGKRPYPNLRLGIEQTLRNQKNITKQSKLFMDTRII